MRIVEPAFTAKDITTIHTLGPTGTNCEAAARNWLARRGQMGRVVLHDTLELAVEEMGSGPRHALLSCIVYPDLHKLVFSNLDDLELVDLFIMSTFNMILASRDGAMPSQVSTHPAPQGLVPEAAEKRLVNSNSRAARDCALGITDGCITTQPAAEAAGLICVTDFGPVPMGFALHQSVCNYARPPQLEELAYAV